MAWARGGLAPRLLHQASTQAPLAVRVQPRVPLWGAQLRAVAPCPLLSPRSPHLQQQPPHSMERCAVRMKAMMSTSATATMPVMPMAMIAVLTILPSMAVESDLAPSSSANCSDQGVWGVVSMRRAGRGREYDACCRWGAFHVFACAG